MLNIVVGMMLTCSVKIMGPGSYGSFVKNVPTKVLFVDTDNQVLVEYHWEKVKSIQVIGMKTEKDLINKSDLLSESYSNCKEIKK